MPEGHSVHRIARQFDLHFVGREVAASSPQGRFAQGADQLTGHTMVQSKAVGKQTFLEFDHGLWLRVHLGIYGAWDFAGDITADATAARRPIGTQHGSAPPRAAAHGRAGAHRRRRSSSSRPTRSGRCGCAC